MSLSTTTTATYALVKYSRAYNHTSHTQAEQGELQWQHFVNPIIRLTMDTRKAVDGHLESYRLRITWQFSAGLDSMDVDQREVVFEDFDLVTYASLPSLQAPQGMPLKAVYQEAVVGIRYQHPRVVIPGTTPQYRRFQIVFDSATSASAFIESIRYVCPCKANAPPPPRMAPRASATLSGSQMPATSVPSVPPRPAGRPSLKPSTYMVPEDHPPPAIRRAGTTLPSFSTLANTTSHWDAPQPPNPTQAPPSRSMSVSPAYSSGSGAVSARDDHAYGSSRPSSAVAHHSSSSSSGPSSAMHAAAATVPVPALVQAHTSAHAASYASAPAPTPAYASTPSRANSFARPTQIQSSTTTLAHSGSSDTSLPSSSFPHSSSSPPPMARLRPSSPDLMPPPPLPAVAAAPRIVTTSPAATQAAIPAPAPVLSPATAPAAATASSSAGTPFAAAPDAIPSVHPGSGEDMSSTPVPTSTVPTSDITAIMRDSAGLYALPKDELEKLVAEVIREDGFADLMKALDGMWRVKGLVGIA